MLILPADPLDTIATIWSVWSGLPAAGAAHTPYCGHRIPAGVQAASCSGEVVAGPPEQSDTEVSVSCHAKGEQC